MCASYLQKDWANTVEKEVLRSLPESEINRQTCDGSLYINSYHLLTCLLCRIIHKVISKEEQYVRDLDLVESVVVYYLPYLIQC